MRLILAQIGKSNTVRFAVKEIVRLIKTMDPSLVLDVRIYDQWESSVKNALWVGLDGSVEYSEQQDKLYVHVKNGVGVISGANERSVLMAAYRFMYELGCRFLYPGADGEKIPRRSLDYADVKADVEEIPSCRHRGICIEGSVGYEHVYNTIDWLPKVGRSAFFMQFFTPSVCFRRYHERFYNDPADRDFGPGLTDEEIDAMVVSLREEIKTRGLVYHAVGHGWTCAPFDLENSGWDAVEREPSEKIRQILAKTDGKRQFFGGKPRHTQLCYSNPFVREKITDSIAVYCKEHTEVDYLYFCLADNVFNHCECEECIKKRPSDYYVDMLNLLDEKLSAEGVDTKIVFSVYTDLFFAPEKETIKNPDRFTLLFAPIHRWHSEGFADVDLDALPEVPPYVRNKEFPRFHVDMNVAFLKQWQKNFASDDSFDFDYHLMWAHHSDPGYYDFARHLHSDMAALERIGLNGMISCQLLRNAFPTGLPQYAMASALWNKARSFEEVKDEYFRAAFGESAAAVDAYLAELSSLFCRGKVDRFGKDAYILRCDRAKTLIKAFSEEYIERYKDTAKEWQYLAVHAVLTDILAEAYIALCQGNTGAAEDLKKRFRAYVKQSQTLIDTVCDDVMYLDNVLEKYLKC